MYLATLLDELTFNQVLLEAVAAADVTQPHPNVPSHVECTTRQGEQEEFLFLLNHSADEEATIPVSPGGTDLLSGEEVREQVVLAPLGAAVIRRSR
ncbi:Beta-galactosidase C-terminal domain [Saccharopolyspora sp. K220]|uniref:Beta-galactosidase C-terminal domain n=1 Tax=Saccharopolyspora soli TaxID=2926618 RepID=UPI001F59147A|nr:Beta-galactosidase C-terminal domain [Saccharopolyspora soli]MCI2415942.1 Beta-galactosidase C-terminal domain [Saccharopolyspora soli]